MVVLTSKQILPWLAIESIWIDKQDEEIGFIFYCLSISLGWETSGQIISAETVLDVSSHLPQELQQGHDQRRACRVLDLCAVVKCHICQNKNQSGDNAFLALSLF